MTQVTTPRVEVGNYLTSSMTTGFINNVNSALASIDQTNIAPYNVQRYHLDFGDGPILSYKNASQYASTGSYNNSSSYEIISHGSKTSEVTFTNALSIKRGHVIRADFSCFIPEIVVNATASNVSADRFYFRLVLEKDDASTIVPGGEWGTSIFVRNSGDTYTTDTPIDTSAYDVLNPIVQRQISLSQVYVSNSANPWNLKKVRWEFIIPSGYHTIKIKEFAVDVVVYQA